MKTWKWMLGCVGLALLYGVAQTQVPGIGNAEATGLGPAPAMLAADTTPPKITVLFPKQGESLKANEYGVVFCKAQGEDPSKVRSMGVSYKTDESSGGSNSWGSPPPAKMWVGAGMSTATLPEGDYFFTFTATDTKGNSGAMAVMFHLQK